jgi:hypothetical protein
MSGYTHPEVLVETRKNIPWGTLIVPDGTFKSADNLRTMYLEQKGVDPKLIIGGTKRRPQTKMLVGPSNFDRQLMINNAMEHSAMEDRGHGVLVSMVSGALVGAIYTGLVGTVHLGVYGRWDHIPAFTLGCVLAGAVLALLGRIAWSLSSEGAPERMGRRTSGANGPDQASGDWPFSRH